MNRRMIARELLKIAKMVGGSFLDFHVSKGWEEKKDAEEKQLKPAAERARDLLKKKGASILSFKNSITSDPYWCIAFMLNGKKYQMVIEPITYGEYYWFCRYGEHHNRFATGTDLKEVVNEFFNYIKLIGDLDE